MTKIVLLGDIHFGVRNDSEYFLNKQLEWFDYFFKYCEENSVTHIIQEGDFFDRRRYANFNTLSKINKVLKNFEKYDTYVISGNHDCYYKSTNEVNSVKILLSNFDIKVISEYPESIKIGNESFDLFPWISPSNYEQTLKFIDNSESDFAIGHFEFSKFEMHPGQLSESGMDHKLFSKYKRAYSGHYHTMSARDNILYTGTPYEMDWSDCSDTKGFWIHEKDNPILIKTEDKIYYKLYYDEDSENKETLDIKNKIVKLFAVNKKNQFKFDRYVDELLSSEPYDLKIIDNTIYESEEVESAENLESLSTIEIISKTVDSLAENTLDKQKLKNLLNELYLEAQQIIE